MTAPALAASRFGIALALGALLGLVYGFLRPLRPRHTSAADALFLCCALGCWLVHYFRICRGDFRFAYFLAGTLGCILCDLTASPVLHPLFAGFWKVAGNIWRIVLLPGKNFLILAKKMIASGEKWVTIRWSNRRHMTHTFGGKPYGRIKRFFQSDQAGPDAHPQPGEGGPDSGHRIVYGRADHPAAGCDGPETED